MKKLRTLLACVTALCMGAVYMPFTESALPEGIFLSAHAEESGTCGENLTWVLDDEGTLTISGTGEMEDFLSTLMENYQMLKKLSFKMV